MTKTEVGTRDIAVVGLTMFLFGGIWTFALWVRKAVRCINHILMGYIGRIIQTIVLIMIWTVQGCSGVFRGEEFYYAA